MAPLGQDLAVLVAGVAEGQRVLRWAAQMGYDVLNVVRLGWEPSSGSVELRGVVKGVVLVGCRQ